MPVKTTNLNRPIGAAALRNVERQRQMAAALQGQAMQPLRGQMAGRVYVAPSPMQGVAKLGQMLAGTYAQNKADEREAQIQADQRQAFATDMQAYEDAIKGTPAVLGRPEVQAVDEVQGVREGGNPYEIYTQQFTEDGQPIGGNTHIPAIPHQDAVAGQEAIQAQAAIPGMDRGQAAMQHLINSQSPMARKMGMSIYEKSLEPKDPIKVGPNEALLDHKSLKELYRNPEKQKKSELRILQTEMEDMVVGSPEYNQHLNQIKKLITPTVTAQIGPSGKPLTPAEKALDTKFSTDIYTEWKYGGASDAQKGIAQLNSAAKALEENADLTGPGTSFWPNAVRAWWNPKSVDIEERVTEIVQRNLRLILGAQFTENEGKRLIARAYNIDLKAKTNAERVRRLVKQIALAAQAKQSAADWYEEHGTLQGWKGGKYSAIDFFPHSKEAALVTINKLFPEDTGAPGGATVDWGDESDWEG
tara:strand:- start:825 stop:2243 length:1419 start_codon:yes stop_codon:yes gene_type:complete